MAAVAEQNRMDAKHNEDRGTLKGGDPNDADPKSLPVRAYLDQTVVPLLLRGMSALVKERPEDPVEWLATYLLKNKNQQQH